MRYRELGASGLRASIVGLGTWVMGGGSAWGRDPDDAESVRAVHAALDAGVNLIDTAPVYGFGRSEEVVGRAIKGRRDKVVLATKCGLLFGEKETRGSFFSPHDGRFIRRSLRPDTIREEVELSLARLGVEHIDLFQTHWPSTPPEKTPIADTMACLLALKDQGKIRAIGVSNVTLAELREYEAAGPVASDQFHYSLLFRKPESDILPYVRKRGIGALAYMPLEQGLLTGKVGMERVFEKGELRRNERWNPWYRLENRARVLALLDAWKPLAERYACTPAQLVIAWTSAQEGVTHVLVGARRAAQAQENAGAGALALDPADLARMRKDVIGLGAPA
jgi:methylglyoxal reductase